MAQEKNFENKIKKYLKQKNIWVIKFFANGFTKRGIPDLLSVVNGYFVAIEVKAEDGEASELQKHNIKEIQKNKGIAIILYPEDFGTFQKMINAINNGNLSLARRYETKINERGMK